MHNSPFTSNVKTVNSACFWSTLYVQETVLLTCPYLCSVVTATATFVLDFSFPCKMEKVTGKLKFIKNVIECTSLLKILSRCFCTDYVRFCMKKLTCNKSCKQIEKGNGVKVWLAYLQVCTRSTKKNKWVTTLKTESGTRTLRAETTGGYLNRKGT